MVSITEQKYEIGHLKQLLDGNKIAYTEVDCSLEENRETRNRYFQASGIRANYPQVFLQDPDGKNMQYIGSFKEIQELNEMNDVPPEILKANNIKTLKSVFAGTFAHGIVGPAVDVCEAGNGRSSSSGFGVSAVSLCCKLSDKWHPEFAFVQSHVRTGSDKLLFKKCNALPPSRE
ncbi:unnamed protein product [Hyaloperonospora brassicae]|uniref:Glutaredoxin domain-containing protein n=1 Tax=Hyaloperonospora brassicae TaxID=162125 RepID=A0AAV0SZI0_HYABA|nr:unnamed protein product [Hyaloperonospora brassicae]